jgi:hypothetical protein
MMTRIGIVGGGPGGLITAYLLRRKYGRACSVKIFEASDRLGGKLQTRRFDAADVPYEAGAAEVYDYGVLGEDTFGTMIDELGLVTSPMTGHAIVMDGLMLHGPADLRRHLGPRTTAAIEDFRARAASLLPHDEWHPGDWRNGARHAWAGRDCADLFEEVRDPVARRYLTIAAHADLATEPHLTDGLNGLRNFVMDVPGYVEYRAVHGGMGEIARRLSAAIPSPRVELGARVFRVDAAPDSPYRIQFARAGRVTAEEFDAVVIALPATQLSMLEWRSEALRGVIVRHLARFDRPGHYLRVSLLFDRPFWKGQLCGSWFAIDAFGGASVYYESARFDASGYGVLGFLLAGNHALALGNVEEACLVGQVLEALPAGMRAEARASLLEARVHRWAGAVSGQPGGMPAADPLETHLPDAKRWPGFLLVGDYQCDSTLNGVHQSADLATTLLGNIVNSVQRLPQDGESAHSVAKRLSGTTSLPSARMTWMSKTGARPLPAKAIQRPSGHPVGSSECSLTPDVSRSS